METPVTSCCLTCFAKVPLDALSKAVVHSCCSRPVCARCLVAMPRLATFCPFCEGVEHAFRKGPRRDVTRAGEAVFDVDSAFRERESQEGAPPAYEEQQQSSGKDTFVLQGEEEEEEVLPDQRTPRLLETSRKGMKQGPAQGRIDRSKSATVSTPLTSSTGPTADSLRTSLSKSAGSSGQGTDRFTSNDGKEPITNDSHSKGGGKSAGRDMDRDTDALTRQYWLRPSDTLLSLSLRFKVNASTLCKLNDLPLSTANTTPHLVHTRRFLLIPEGAVQSALSSNTGVELLESALKGPAAQSRRQTIQRARREAQSRFRATVAKNETMGKERGSRGDQVTQCDERAAKAYISLMEAELKFIDFGDGLQGQEEGEGEDEEEEVDAAVEASRRDRFNVIVKQAVCRWEMDSDWERQQRALGITPTEAMAADSTKSKASSSSNDGTGRHWLARLTSPSRSEARRVQWLEKTR